MPHFPWSNDHTPEELLAIANINLKNARSEADHKKSLKLADKAISNIRKAEKIFSAERCKNSSLEDGIANGYHEHGALMEKLGDSKHAQESHSKATKWGYTDVIGGGTPSSQASDKTGPSDQSLSHLGSPTTISSPVTTNQKVSDTNDNQSPSDNTSTTTGVVSHMPSNIFKNNVAPPIIKCDLPDIGHRIASARQLVYCLGLLTVSNEDLDPRERDWVLKINANADEKERLDDIASDLIRAFVRDELKSNDEVDEVVWLAPVLNQDYFRILLQLLVDGIKYSTLLKVNMVDGLVRLMRNSGSRPFDTDDLVKILDLLSSRLKDTHGQSTQLIYKLTLAVSAVLDSMADNNVKGLSREQLHGPLVKYLECLQDNPEPYLIYQAAYAYQALQYVPDDESRSQAIQRNAVNLLQGVIGVATGAKGMDIGSVIDGLKRIHETVSEVAKPFIFNIKANVESGQKLMNNLKDGFRYRRDWYPALRAIDIGLQSGRLLEVKQLVNQAPSYLDPAFQLGLCQRLGELAINPLWDLDSRQDAVDLLVEMYKNDIGWGQHDGVKKWILHILRQLKDSSNGTVSEKAGTLLQDLKTNSNAKKQDIYDEFEKEPSSSYPLMVARPPNTSRLLTHINSKPSLSTVLNKLRFRRLKEGHNELYISPRAKRSPKAKDDFDLLSDLQEFLKSDKKVYLLLGDSGSGKSTFNRAFEVYLWQNYNKMDKRIPLFIYLPSIENPEKDMITKQLQNLLFTNEHIQELREDYEFILICDAYDETQLTTNLYMSNQFNQEEGWRVQMVISCRTEYNGVDYIGRFQPIDRNAIGTSALFQEAVIVQFNKDQIQTYIKQYVSINKSTETRWETKDYEQALLQIPTLQDLMKNPFLLRLAMEVLPQIMDPAKDDFKLQKITRITLYDEFVKLWLERNRKRLEELKPNMKDAETEIFDHLCGLGFTHQGIEFMRDLSQAIFIENKSNPVFSYPNKSGQGSWQAAFFNKKNANQFLIQSIPLLRNEKQYRFLHRSILEYGLTLSVFDQITTRQTRESGSAQSYRACTNYVRGLEMEIPEDELDNQSERSFMDTPFGKKSFVNESSILQFLVERVQQQPTVFKKLIVAVEQSKINIDASIAAANAITVLVRAGVQFNGANLRGINIPGADLSFGVFDATQLQGADLQNANLRNIWLHQANLDEAQMDGVQFGELPLLKQDDEVRCCAYSFDGSLLAAGSKSGTVSIYNTSNWIRTQVLTGHEDEVKSLSFSPSNDRIASRSNDKTVRLWDVDTGKCLHTFQGHGRHVASVAYSPKGDRIASGGYDKTARLWDVDTGECLQTFQGHSHYVSNVVYSPKGNQIASGSQDMTVRLWDVDTGECTHILEGHFDNVKNLVYSPKGDRLASGSEDMTVRLWDVNTGECVHLLLGHCDYVTGVIYSPKGDRIVSGSDDMTLRLWDVNTGECIRTLQVYSSYVASVVYSPKGDRIASGSEDKAVRLWDVETGECIHTLEGHSDNVTSVVYSPKGDQIASGSYDETVRVWDVDRDESVHTFQVYSSFVTTVVYSPKGDRIASGSTDKIVRLWDVDTGECIHILHGHSDDITIVAYSPKGDRVASGSTDKTVRLWDVDTGECIHALQGHSHYVSNVVYSPKGDQIASGSEDKTVRLWNVDTGECIYTLEGHDDHVKSLVYSPKGDRIASGSRDKTVRLWDVDTGECVHTLCGHSGSVTSIAYSPKGDQIASGSGDMTVRLWDVDTGECVRTLQGHSGYVRNLVYSPKGDRLASGSEDNTVRLWDVGTGECIHSFQGHSHWVTSLMYSPEGDRIASGSRDKTVRMWNLETGQCETTISGFNEIVTGISLRSDSGSLFLATGSWDKSVRHWKIAKEGDEYKPTLLWSSSHEVLTVSNLSFKDVHGLSKLNRDLLIQRTGG